MTDNPKEKPPQCFGCLERVFPIGREGLRESPPGCLCCACKTECLRRALSGEQGIVVHEERLERAYRFGGVGFLERWSQQKRLAAKRKGRKSRWAALWSRLRRSAAERGSVN